MVATVVSASGSASTAGSDQPPMTTGQPDRAAASTAPRTLGIIPPAMTPPSIRWSAVAGSSRRMTFRCSSRTPGTSVSSSNARAPSTRASPLAASSALTFTGVPSASIPIDATTGTRPVATRSPNSAELPPVTVPTAPGSNPHFRRSTAMPSSSARRRAVAVTPRRRRSASRLVETRPASTAVISGMTAAGVMRIPSRRSVWIPSRSRCRSTAAPPPWTRANGVPSRAASAKRSRKSDLDAGWSRSAPPTLTTIGATGPFGSRSPSFLLMGPPPSGSRRW